MVKDRQELLTTLYAHTTDHARNISVLAAALAKNEDGRPRPANEVAEAALNIYVAILEKLAQEVEP